MTDQTMTLTSNLVDDPELRFTPSGQPVANFRVASTPRYRDNADPPLRAVLAGGAGGRGVSAICQRRREGVSVMSGPRQGRAAR